MKRFGPLLLFLLLVVGGGLALGLLAAPTEWYAGLAKPGFNPPSWLFAPVWTFLYVLIAVAGWHTFERAPSSRPMKLWWVQLVLNFLWSPVFFAAHRIGFAFLVILLLLASILAFLVTSWWRNRLAAWLFTPYAGWVAFAAVLNGSIWALN